MYRIPRSVLFKSGTHKYTVQALCSVPHPNSNPINTKPKPINTNINLNCKPNPNTPNYNHTPRTENSLEQIQLSVTGDGNVIYAIPLHSSSTSLLNVLIITVLETITFVAFSMEESFKPLTYVTSLILSKKFIFITSYDVKCFHSSYVALILSFF